MIHELLNHGEENALTGRYISSLLNIKSRDVTAVIQRERKEGKPICANTGDNPGYYLAADKEEMLTYCKSLEHREAEVRKTRLACLKTVKGLPDKAI